MYQLPSPKLQFHIVGVSPPMVSVNNTTSGAVPDEVFAVKSAISCGGGLTIIVLPPEVDVLTAFETVRYTV